MMFGIADDELLTNLEKLRQSLCCYASTPYPATRTCDCQFGASGQGEQTGCPELRQVIAIIRGQREQVIITRQLFEVNATNTLKEIERAIEKWRVEKDESE